MKNHDWTAGLSFEEAATLALKSAVKKAIAERTAARLPVYVWKDGKVVDLNAPLEPKKRFASGQRGTPKKIAERAVIRYYTTAEI